MTVGELIVELEKYPKTLPVWTGSREKISPYPIDATIATTFGDPSIGMYGGDPSGIPAIMLTDHRGAEEYRSYVKKTKKHWKKSR
jgi:hypothetical protein